MSFSPETIIFLLQFDTGFSYREIARQSNIPLTQINSIRYNNVITKKTHESIATAFGDDWDDIEKVRIYQKRYNQVMNLDYKRLKSLREKKGLTLGKAAVIFRMHYKTVAQLENGERTFNHYPQYQEFASFYENDLFKPKQRKKKDSKPVHYMTFKNIAKRGGKICWETGTKIKI